MTLEDTLFQPKTHFLISVWYTLHSFNQNKRMNLGILGLN